MLARGSNQGISSSKEGTECEGKSQGQARGEGKARVLTKRLLRNEGRDSNEPAFWMNSQGRDSRFQQRLSSGTRSLAAVEH